MSIQVSLGNLINNTMNGMYDAMMHGCNCFHGEDSGFAAQVWEAFPEARQASMEDHDSGDFSAFGEISTHYYSELGTTIINAYTQYHGGANFDIDAFINILKQVEEDFSGCVIGIPRIGTGIGSSDWLPIEDALLMHAPSVDWQVVVLDTTPKYYGGN